MPINKQQSRRYLSRKNPLFEKYVALSRSQQVALVQDLFQNVEDEIAHSRADTIKVLASMSAQIPNFVQELEKKNFWKYSPQTQILAYPEILFIPDLRISYTANALNTQLKNTPLKVYIIASETLDKGTLAFYSSANHSVYMPIKYEKVFEQGNFSTSVKISKLTQAIKTELWLCILIHEVQHARDYVELQNFDYKHFIEHQSQMAIDLENIYNQKKIDLQKNPKKSQADIAFDDSESAAMLSDMLKTDFQILLEHLNTNNQSMLKSSQKRVQTLINNQVKPFTWTQLEQRFIATNSISLSIPQTNLNTLSFGKYSIPFKSQSQSQSQSQNTTTQISGKASQSQVQKQLTNSDFYASIQEQILKAFKEYPNSYRNIHSSKNHLIQLETAFKECSSSIRYTSKYSEPTNFVGFFQVEGVDFAQRLISKFLNQFRFDPNMELPITQEDLSHINPNWQAILLFTSNLKRILMNGEIYTYRTQEVEETISDAILGIDKETASLFHGSAFYKQVFSRFEKFRYTDFSSQIQSIKTQLLYLKFETDSFFRKALSDLFDQIFQIDFNLVKDTFFDFSSQIKDCSYADLNTNQPYVTVNGKQIDVKATKEQIVELFFLAFENSFFSKNKCKLLINLFEDILVSISSVGVFLPTILEKNANLISDSLCEVVMADSEIKSSVDLITNLSKKVMPIRDQLWQNLSFFEKYVSISHTILLGSSHYNDLDSTIGFCLKHKARLSSLSALYDDQNKKIPLVKGIPQTRLHSCLDFIESKIGYVEHAIYTYIDAIRDFYSVCTRDYISMHPDKKGAQGYIENLNQLHEKWTSKFKQAYTIHLKDTKSSQDSHSQDFLVALQPFVDFFYENTVDMVFTSGDFDQYIIQPNEASTLNFQKLVESRHMLTKHAFRKFHKLMLSRLIIQSKIFAQDPIKAQIEMDEIQDMLGEYNLLLGENTENLIYVLRDADQVSDHYKLGIILSLLSHNLALCTISQFFLENT